MVNACGYLSSETKSPSGFLMNPHVNYLYLTCVQKCKEKLMMSVHSFVSPTCIKLGLLEVYIKVIYQSSHSNQVNNQKWFDATLV